jgi:hypothetical protein
VKWSTALPLAVEMGNSVRTQGGKEGRKGDACSLLRTTDVINRAHLDMLPAVCASPGLQERCKNVKPFWIDCSWCGLVSDLKLKIVGVSL